ncbi:MAG: discoidin domain-containing protein [Candidatus Hydrogenedentes bacterium]|nr:discoidin domain-containing protein [Candidatus Hydrogenedentota bacterium]
MTPLFKILQLSMVMLFLCLAAAADKPAFVTASSMYSEEYLPIYALDNNSDTRWASKAGISSGWLQIDFGEVMPVGDISIEWEHAHARSYEVQISIDNSIWETVYNEDNGSGDTDTVSIPDNTKGRYLRIFCTIPSEHGLYSIWEISFEKRKNRRAIREKIVLLEQEERQRNRENSEALHTSLKKNGIGEIVFITRSIYEDGHWYANISYYAQGEDQKTYVHGSSMYIYNVESDSIRPLIEDKNGTLRDPCVHYDGKRILFSWRRDTSETFHLYTINKDGSGITQLTNGEYDDIEPAWLPDGGIVFVSTRCRRWVNCWLTQVAVVHRCDANGSNIIPLSANLEHDNTPWPLPDGRILYTRWEYVDRSQVDYHHLWTMNPDGTGQMTYFGNLHPPGLYIDAKPIPETDEVVLINSPGHGAREHAGHVAIVNIHQGPDHLPSLRNISGNGFRDPYPITKNIFIAAQQRNLILLDRSGNITTVHRIKATPKHEEVHEPRPIFTRQHEAIIPPRTDYKQTTGFLVLADAHLGRNMKDVAPSDIKKLLVIETLPKPINYTGGMDPLSYGGTFTLERLLGEVPVESDGSAYLEVPANRPLFFVTLDKNDQSVKRMQSFLTVMPGETVSCIGCHEERTQTPFNDVGTTLKALQRPPSRIKAISNLPEVFDFPRDIQPILDKHCLSCHDYESHEGSPFGPRSGGVILSGDRGPMFSHSYASLTIHGQIADGRNRATSNYPPRTLGAGASPLMHKIQRAHHGVLLSEQEISRVRYWIETGAAYPGTYGALGGGCVGGYHENIQIETDYEWKETVTATAAIKRRCFECHQDNMQIPVALSDENGLSFWRPDWNDPRLKRSRHLAFNLSRPECSLILLAPLAKEAGGYGICSSNTKGSPIFTNSNDPDYQAILDMCKAGKTKLDRIKRFDMKGYQPPTPYIREMIRYGVLPKNYDRNTPVDSYALDKAYWESFSQEVALEHPAYLPMK